MALPVPSERDARYIIGLGLNDSLQRLLPDLPASEYPKLAERYRSHFLARDHESVLFAGVKEMLASLSDLDYALAVATGKSRTGLDRALAHTGIGALFRASRCADESFSKPHPGMLYDLMDYLGVAAQDTLMIGDTCHDLQMAANAGIDAVAVAYGAHAREDLTCLKPLACVDSVPALTQWLMHHA